MASTAVEMLLRNLRTTEDKVSLHKRRMRRPASFSSAVTSLGFTRLVLRYAEEPMIARRSSTSLMRCARTGTGSHLARQSRVDLGRPQRATGRSAWSAFPVGPKPRAGLFQSCLSIAIRSSRSCLATRLLPTADPDLIGPNRSSGSGSHKTSGSVAQA